MTSADSTATRLKSQHVNCDDVPIVVNGLIAEGKDVYISMVDSDALLIKEVVWNQNDDGGFTDVKVVFAVAGYPPKPVRPDEAVWIHYLHN
jgi:hypothetical protein